MSRASHKPARTAYAYLRVSSQGQEDGHGFDRQADTIARFAKGAKIQVVEAFRDAHTGTEADRPAFGALVAACKSNGTRTVIVESLDRLARSLSVQIALLSLLEREGITLLSASTGQDVTADVRDDPMREAMVMMQGVFAQTEKKLLVRKLARAREAVRQAGGHSVGCYAYGQHPQKPEELRLLERVAELRAAVRGRRRMTRAAVAAQLNAEGFTNRSGGPWTAAALRRVAP